MKTDRHAFEALDRTLKDLTGNSHPMGGICMFLCGALGKCSQLFHVAPVVDACFKKSHLWDNVHVVVKNLQTNMRVHLCGDQAAGQIADQLLAIGDGKVPVLLMLSSYCT